MMSHLVEDANDIDPDLELRGRCFKVRFSEKFLKCPFCPDSKDCGYNDLLRHANQISRESRSVSFKEKATHMGLVEYLEKEFQAKIKSFVSASVNSNASEELYVWPWMSVVANIDYNRVEVNLLMKLQGHSDLAVVEFGKFMKALEVNKHSGKDWFDWEEFNSYGVVGDYLRENGDLKTVDDFQKEDESVILGLKTMIEEINKRCEEMNVKISQTDDDWVIVMKEKEVMTENFNRDMEMAAQEQLNRTTTEHGWMLEEREMELKAGEAINETKKRKLDDERREKEKLHQRIIELEKKLDEKEEQLKELEELNQSLVIEEQTRNEELVEARKELIRGWSGNSCRAHVVVKIMGELDVKPFIASAKRHCSNQKEASENAIKLASLWENYLKDPSWHPFKIITVEGNSEEILDEEDEKITSLKNEYEKDVYDAVVTALKELNEYNPSGRYLVPELWNNMEGRRATLKEGVEVVLNQLKIYKQRNRV